MANDLKNVKVMSISIEIRSPAQKWHDENLRKQLKAEHDHRITKEAIEGIICSLNMPREINDKNDLLRGKRKKKN